MTEIQTAVAPPRAPSITFVPLPRAKARTAPPVSYASMPLVAQVLDELSRPLGELARRVERLGPVAGGTVVMLTGCRRGAGCTTVSIALAAAAATSRRVLLVDADLARPGLATTAGLRPRYGWDESVYGVCSVEEAVQPLPLDVQVPCLALRQPVARRDELLARVASEKWLANLRNEYELIVLDGGSVWESGSAWTSVVDVALVVCDSGRTLADEWARAWDRLEECGSHVLGIVETFV